MTDNWLAPDVTTLPDFIICGAMKCGTSTLHAMLNKHPDIFIPDKEVHFFDADNTIQHPDFNRFSHGGWRNHALGITEEKKDFSKHWQWYNQQFSSAKMCQVVGEDSTTYLASPLAAKRIAMQNKAIKFIVMLRQPSKRAYSQYWHLVQSGRAIYNFEDTLQLNPYSVLNRSMYLTQINELLQYIPKERIKFVIFEHFLENKKTILKDICNFINVPFEGLPLDVEQIHQNNTTYPKYYHLQLFKNRLFPKAGNLSYGDHFNQAAKKSPREFLHYINAIHRKLNPLVTKKTSTLSDNTKQFLDRFFIRELDGLSELIDQDVYSLWFK